MCREPWKLTGISATLWAVPDETPCRACRAPVPAEHRYCPYCGADQLHMGLEPGAVVDGRYRVERRLARGGMAEVFLAEQLAMGRRVALKVLFAEHTRDAAALASFRREAQAASRLNHPNTVTVHDFGETETGRLYIAMEHIEGQDLATMMQAGEALTWRRLCDLFVQVCASLHDAHERGVVHRDLKPENVMVVRSSDGRERVKVLDFGIARVVVDGAEPQTDRLYGTAEFIAPELLLGGEPGPASDVYSLGVMLYEALTRRLPYEAANTEALLQAHVFSQPLPFRALADRPVGVPVEVESLVLSMLATAPDRRPPSMEAVARVLSAARAAMTTPPAPGATLPPAITGVDDGPAVRRLLERLNQSTGFPTFAANVAAINRVCGDPGASAHDLAEAVRRDFGVTEKLLRLVNSAFYRRHNAPVSTVHRAIVVLGFEQVRRAALSLMYWSMLDREGRADELDATLGAVASGLVARNLAAGVDGVDPEEAFVCALFQRFGWQLAMHYLADDLPRYRRAVEVDGLDERQAAERTFGMDFRSLGRVMAERLGFPDAVVDSMGSLDEASRRSPRTAAERRHALALFSNALVDAFADADPLDRDETLRALAARLGGPLALGTDRCVEVLVEAAATLAEDWADADIDLSESRLYRAMERAGDGAGDLLRLALERVRHAFDRGAAVEAVVAQALAGFVDGAKFSRALFCLKNFKDGTMSARMGVGQDARGLVPRFRFDVSGDDDLLRRALLEGQDLVVEDARLPNVRGRLPAWYLRDVAGAAFVLYPVRVRGVAVGAFYADEVQPRRDPPWLDPGRREALAQMRDLVEQALQRVGGARPG